MATIDTGMGWYADENWLRQSSGLMGRIATGGGSGSFVEVPFSETYRQATTADCYVGLFAPSYSLYEYCMNTDGNPVYFAYIARTDNRRTIFYASRVRATLVSGYVGGGNNPDAAGQLSAFDSGSGYYYYTGVTTSGPYPPFNESAPVFATVQDALTALPGAEDNYYKMNSGYAVSCFAHYLNHENKLVYAPVLISSTPAYTNMSKVDPSGGQATNIATRSEFAISDVVFTLGFGEEVEGDSLTATGAAVLDMPSSLPFPAPGAGLYGLLWYYIKQAASIGVGSADDPFNPGGSSSTGGGTGNFDGTGDSIGFPGLPSISATDAGFITLFVPTTAQLVALADYMWQDPGFDLNTFRKIFANPMDAILGMSIIPVQPPIGGSKAVRVGNISTGITMNVAASQYVTVDCGTLNVQEFWGAYLDYDPYTKCEIYLPYIGTHALAVDDVMGKAVHVVYHVDILSGSCCAYIQCDGTVLYSFVGQCASSIPITGNDWTNVINGALSIGASIGTMIATGGASAPMIAGAATTAVNQLKPTVEKSGSMSGTGGMLGVQTPYLILTRPRQALPASQNTFTGYPSFITANLGDLNGYTEIESMHLEGIPATDAELSEIESLLKSGVIF